MTRTLRILGLAMMAIGALSAVAASGASAAEFHCEGEPCTLTGTTHEGKDRFAASGFTAEAVSHLFGTAIKTTQTTQAIYPEYTACESSLGKCEIDVNGCAFVLGSTTNATGHLPAQISCSGTNALKVTAPGCTLILSSQNMTGGVKATNIGTGSTREITGDVTASYTFTKSGTLCFAISGNAGTYTATWTLKGYEDRGACPAQAEQPYTCAEGVQTGIWWE